MNHDKCFDARGFGTVLLFGRSVLEATSDSAADSAAVRNLESSQSSLSGDRFNNISNLFLIFTSDEHLPKDIF
jgi:hypothetical protein